MDNANQDHSDGEVKYFHDPHDQDADDPLKAKRVTCIEHSQAMRHVKKNRFSEKVGGVELERQERSPWENTEVYHLSIFRSRGQVQPAPSAVKPTNSGESFYTGHSHQQMSHQQVAGNDQAVEQVEQQQSPFSQGNFQMQSQGQQLQNPQFQPNQFEGDSYGYGGTEHHNWAPPGSGNQFNNQHLYNSNSNNNVHSNQLWMQPGGVGRYEGNHMAPQGRSDQQYQWTQSGGGGGYNPGNFYSPANDGARISQHHSGTRRGEKRVYDKPKSRQDQDNDTLHAAFQQEAEGVLRRGVSAGKFGVNDYLTAKAASFVAPAAKIIPCWYHCYMDPKYRSMPNLHSEADCILLSRMDPGEIEVIKKASDDVEIARREERERKRLNTAARK